jgi:hypothetical protein
MKQKLVRICDICHKSFKPMTDAQWVWAKGFHEGFKHKTPKLNTDKKN